MASKGIAHLSNPKALERIGNLIDASHAPRRSAGAKKALAWADELERRDLSPDEQCILDYFRSNAWDALRPKRRLSLKAAWGWKQPIPIQQLYFLRRSATGAGFANAPPFLRCNVHTNLGNILSHTGRTIEAIEAWSKALAVHPQFWMASGNRGLGYSRLGQSLYDHEDNALCQLFAHRDLTRAIGDAAEYPMFGYPEALERFVEKRDWIEAHGDLSAIADRFDLDGHSMGRSKRERQYRQWCLREGLFLNPLNDLGRHSIAANDPLGLPSFYAPLGEPPVLIGFFNQLKQEFVSARFSYFEGITAHGLHYSDRGVSIINTLDYTANDLAAERVRTAYRVTYSLFDKVAFFLNHYMKLGHAEKSVSFANVWRARIDSPKSIHPVLEKAQNGYLRGLYGISRDLFDDTFTDVADPDAKALHELRLNLEHRYLKVHMMGPGRPGRQPYTGDLFVDTLAYSVSRDDLERRTLRLLKLVRAALIYLSLGMHWEERRRARKRRSKRLIASQDLGPMRDKWKRRD
jgi:tetratricopeptide (TPR) repeat protein